MRQVVVRSGLDSVKSAIVSLTRGAPLLFITNVCLMATRTCAVPLDPSNWMKSGVHTYRFGVNESMHGSVRLAKPRRTIYHAQRFVGDH